MCKSKKPDTTHASATSASAAASENKKPSPPGESDNPPTLRTRLRTRLRKLLRFGEEKQADTKTIFDSLRNMGICIAMLLGLPSFYTATDYLANWAQTGIGLLVIGGASALAGANIMWTIQSLKERSAPCVIAFLIVLGSGVIFAFLVSAFFGLPGFCPVDR
ncbi:hypothetical protein [Pseudomonas viridiflava]|uniref:hypothetical protein n=1 Tax=Pseudomonas syringae group TaxID=136849 RepID=UPI0013CE8583|nr:hypothetical protein [Pseudomonas viridiflava]